MLGKDGKECMAFMEKLSEYFDPVVLRGEKSVKDDAVAQQCMKIPALIDVFIPTIERNLKKASAVHYRSWECMAFYVELCRMLAKVEYTAACGKGDEMESCWSIARDYVCKNELRFQKELDVFEFLNIWENKILPRFREQAEVFVE